FPPAQAFVVQFGRDTDVETGRLAGRVEHVVSGHVARFQSLDELVGFMTAACARFPRPRAPRAERGRGDALRGSLKLRGRGKETAMSTHVKGLVRGRYLGRRSPMRRTRQQSTDNDPPRRSARGTALVGWGLVGLLALGSLGLGGFVERTAAAQDRFKFE